MTDAVAQFIATYAGLAEAINQVADIVHETAKDKGWWDEERNDGELLALIHSEVSEALEVLRKDPEAMDDKVEFIRAIEAELADVIIRVLDFAKARGYDIGTAVIAKAGYNTTRERKHGKRF